MDGLKVSTASATGNPRNKVALKQGRSLMDWIRLTNSGADLSGTAGQMRDITAEELARHNKPTDAWLAIRGLVYNVTSYFEYHPGGEEELIRGIGIDATDLFDQVHKWVNYESMLKKCLVGRLKTDAPSRSVSNGASFRPPAPPLPGPKMAPSEVTSDWIQNTSTLTLVFYTRQKGLDQDRISLALDAAARSLRVRICMDQNRCYDYGVQLARPVRPECTVSVSAMTGKVELAYSKVEALQWATLGQVDPQLGGVISRSQAPTFYRRAVLSGKISITHNVHLFTFSFPRGDVFHVPIGWHVQLKLLFKDGSEVMRSYTPVLPDLSGQILDCPNQEEAGGCVALHFLIKIYSDGPFTGRLNQLLKGEEVLISEPTGSFSYKDSQLETKDLVAIAAGTGITPMIRLMVDSLKNDRNASLLFCNRGLQDVMWNDELDNLKDKYPDKFKVWNILSEPDQNWTGLKGRISSSILKSTSHVTESESGRLVCVCGPSDFTLETLRLLDDVGFKSDTIHAFSG